jgi:hypothetical protein
VLTIKSDVADQPSELGDDIVQRAEQKICEG